MTDEELKKVTAALSAQILGDQERLMAEAKKFSPGVGLEVVHKSVITSEEKSDIETSLAWFCDCYGSDCRCHGGACDPDKCRCEGHDDASA